jgi:hypothetical protein
VVYFVVDLSSIASQRVVAKQDLLDPVVETSVMNQQPIIVFLAVITPILGQNQTW